MFNSMYDLIQGRREADIFSQGNVDNRPRTLSEAIKEVLKIDYNGKTGSNIVGVGSETGIERRRGSTGDVERGGRGTEGERAADGKGRAKGDAGEEGVADKRKALHPSSVASKDNQGNPINADGTLKLEKIKSVDDLTDEDFSKPTRNVELPAIPKNVDDAIGANGKPIIIKKNIFERNAERHSDLTPEQSREILHSALYNPDLYGQNQKAKRPYNWVVINTKDEKGHNRTVLLEISPNKDNIEIVHWHYVDERGLEKIKRQAEREDGQLLILPSAKEEAGALSSPTSGLSSDGKVTAKASKKQGKGKKKVEPGQQVDYYSAFAEQYGLDAEEAKKETVANAPEKAKEVKGLSNKLKDRYPNSLYLLGRDISDMEEMVANGEVSPKRVERVRSEIKRLKGLLADYERLATPEERSWRHKKAEHPDEIVVVDRGNGLLVVCQEDVKATNKAIGHKLDAPVTENLIVTTNEEQGMPFTTMRVTLADLQRLDDKGVKYVVLDKNGNQAKAKSKKQGKGEKKVEPGQQVDYYSAFAEQYGLDAEEAKKETEGNKPSEASLSLSTPLTDEEVVAITDAMKANATVAPTVEINDANWKESVETPVGSVKMGENQKAKLFAKGREQQYGMLLETLSNPDVVLEEKDKEQNMFHERPSSYLFVKTFQKEDGSKYVHFESVTVSQEGMEVSISSHIIRENQLKNKLKSDRLLYKATALDAPANTSAEQPIVGGSLSSDGKDTEKGSSGQEDGEKNVLSDLEREFQKALEHEEDVEQKWEVKIQDYVAEHYPTQATVSAETKSAKGLEEREAMKSDSVLRAMREKADAENKKAADATFAAWKKMEASKEKMEAREHKADVVENPSHGEEVLRDAVIDKLRESGIEVLGATEGQKVLDMANGKDVRLEAKRKRALETASVSRDEKHQPTVVSSADGAKILNNLDTLATEYDNLKNYPKTFTGDVAKALGADRFGSGSEYATFETKNGQIVTIRLANHNARVSGFDHNKRDNGISIVISSKPNAGITNNGDAHIVEFYYDSIKLRRADGKPLAEIVRSIKQALYSGVFKDPTGLAERQEVNADDVISLQKVYHGSGADFDHFDHSHMGEGEGAQAYGWGTYVTEVEGIGRTYAEQYVDKHSPSKQELEELWEDVKNDAFIEADISTREKYGITEPIFLETGYYVGDADTEALLKEACAYYGYDVADYYDEDGEIDEDKCDELFVELFSDMDSELENELNNRKSDFIEEHLKDLNPILYTVEIPDDTGENYLDWDAPIGNEQIASIRKYLSDNYRKQKIEDFDASIAETKNAPNADEVNAWVRRGENVYKTLAHLLGSDKEASKALSEMGFVGIKYPAQYRSGGRKDGAKNYVIFDEKDAKITDHVRFFKTKNGEAYGFTVGGKIYIDPRIANAETPIHEYAHLWASALRSGNPKEWENVVGLMKGTPVWDEVKKRYPELETDEEIADEVIATYSGRRGAERLRSEAGKIAGSMDELDAVKALSALQRVKEALKRFWKGVCDFLHIHFTSAEEVADRVMKDLLDGVDPRSMMDGGRSLRSDTEINIVEGAKEHGFKNYAEAKTWAKGHIARTYSGEETGGKGDIRISNVAVDKYLSQSAVDKSDSKDVHLSVLKVLPDVIRESVDAEQHADYKKGEDGVRSAKNGINPNVTIHRLYGAVRMDGKVYRVKVTLKEDKTSKEPKVPHSYEATKIELLAGTLGNSDNSLSPNTNNSITAAKLLNGVEKSYGGGRFFEDEDKVRLEEAISNRTLAGVHNISEDKLRKALKLGGLANPSVAVIDTDKQGHSGYGEISLILPSSMVEKRTGRNAGTFFGDAWTPTYPQVERIFGKGGSERAVKDIESVPDVMERMTRNAVDSWLDGRSADDLAYLYLQEHGKQPHIVVSERQYPETLHNDVKEVLGGYKSLYDVPEERRRQLLDIYVREKFEGNMDEYAKGLQNKIQKMETTISKHPKSSLMKYRQMRVDDMKRRGYDYDALSRFVDDLIRDEKNAGKPLDYATMQKARDYIKENHLQKGFEEWKENLAERYKTKEVIFNGFTPSGKRRYVDNTLENVSKLMKQKGRNGAQGWGASFNNFAANIMQSSGTLKGIKSHKEKLTDKHEDIDAFTEKWGEVYNHLADVLNPNADISTMDVGYYRLQETAVQKEPKEFAKKEYGVELSDNDVQQLDEMVKAIREERPAMYFETKFERPVMLDEFAAAVVPQDLGADVRKGLEYAGLQLFDYDSKKEGDRKRAFDEAVRSDENIRFQFIGERGAAAADHAEEVNTRIDNLSVAREMEEAKKDAKAIKMATGWERGADGKWRYEIPDAKIKDTIDVGGGNIVKRYEEGMLWNDGKLEDAVDAPKLFEAYPQLKNIKIHTDAVMNYMPSNGYYNPQTNTITIHAADLKYLNSILNHEIQHAIQNIEGFAQGGNSKTVRSRIQKIIDDEKDASEHAKSNLKQYAALHMLASRLKASKQFAKSDQQFFKDKAREYYWDAMNELDNNERSTLINEYPDDKNAQEIAESGYHVDEAIKELKRIADEYKDEIPKGNMDAFEKVNKLTSALGNKSDDELYQALAGEVEARNVQKRMDMTPEERRNSLASETEDVDRGDQIVMNNGGTSYSIVKDPETIKKLDKEDTVKVYRAMQVGEDGKLYPPMAAKVKGKFVQPIELGKWEQADERPELADDKGMFTLNKGNGKSLKAAYNPYLHTSRTPLNDQFSEAQNRPNIVTVEVEVPKSELTSGYKADKAKDAVGEVEWKAGIIQGQLTGKRKVILSRWDKPVRIVPDSEVADVIVNDMFKGKNITMPSNVVTPSLRKELEKRGVPFVETDNRGRIVGGENDGVHYSKVYGKKANVKHRFGETGFDDGEREELERVNERFNEELTRYQNGEMDKNEMLHLGRPQGVMRAFLPNLPIVMRQRILTKGSVRKHNVAIEALADMPNHLSRPIFVFKRSDNELGVLTEMQDRDGKKVCVAIELNRQIQNGGEILEVNDIRSVHGRNVADIVYPIVQNGTLKWADKEKGLAYLSSASRYVQQEIDKQDLDTATKIVENFENPKVSGENVADDGIKLSLGDGVGKREGKADELISELKKRSENGFENKSREELEETFRILCQLNALAFKGYRRLSDTKLEHNGKVYSIKHKMMKPLADALYKKGADVAYDGYALYLRNKDGVQMSLHTHMPGRSDNDFEDVPYHNRDVK